MQLVGILSLLPAWELTRAHPDVIFTSRYDKTLHYTVFTVPSSEHTV